MLREYPATQDSTEVTVNSSFRDVVQILFRYHRWNGREFALFCGRTIKTPRHASIRMRTEVS